jgi:hypothetical protein
VIGSLIIKTKLSLSDEETIAQIQENPYLQYFVGLSEYTYNKVFDPSLFVTIRKRLGTEEFDFLTKKLLTKSESIKRISKSDKGDSDNPPKNKGKLLMDATVAEQMVLFPTDTGLLNESRELSEELIKFLCKSNHLPTPRTYKKRARKVICTLCQGQ